MLLNYFENKMTLREICNFANMEVPPYLTYIENKVLTNMALHKKFIRKGGCFFLTATYTGEALKNVIDFARKEGAIAIFVTFEQYRQCDNKPDLIPCELPGKIARGISNKIRKDLNLRVIGVTGSVGKTTTKDFIYSVIKENFNVAKSIGNENTQYPIFHNMQRLSKKTEIFVQEFGIGTKGTINFAIDSCIPDIGVITNIKNVHISNYGSLENILKEKEKMIKKMPAGSPLILNYDDDLLKNWKWEKYKTIWVSSKDKRADYYASNIREENGCMLFDVISNREKFEILLPILGTHNVINAVVAVAIGDILGISKKKIIEGLSSYKSSGIRQRLTSIGGYKLYLDCYNNTAIDSLVGAVEVLEKLNISEKGRKIAIISNVDVGDVEPDVLIKMNKEAGRKIAGYDIDIFVCFGNEYTEALYSEISKAGRNALYINERDVLDDWIKDNITKNDIALYKGAFRNKLVRTIDYVYGTCFQTETSTEDLFFKEYKYRVIDGGENDDRKIISILKYMGDEGYIKIPSEIDNIKVFSIGNKCFANNKKVKKITIPENIINIDNQAFINCENLREIEFPHSLKLIGAYAFKNCINIESIELFENIVEVGKQAFAECKNIKTFTLKSITGEIDKSTFEGCENIKISY